MATPNRYSGRVSPEGSAAHEAIAATMSRTQAASSALVRNEPVTRISQCLDRRRGPELSAQPADADVDDVGARAEVVAPDGGEEPLAAQDLVWVECEVVQQPELAVGEVGLGFADARASSGHVELQGPGAHDVRRARPDWAEMDADPGEQLVE